MNEEEEEEEEEAALTLTLSSNIAHSSLPLLKVSFSSAENDCDDDCDDKKCIKRFGEKFHGKEIILIGTAHVSKRSQETTEFVIKNERPEIVFIELDKARLHSLLRQREIGRTESIKELKEKVRTVPRALELMMYKARESLGFVYAILSVFVDAEPGGEFVKAIEKSGEIGALVVLGDRDSTVTMKRIYSRLARAKKKSTTALGETEKTKTKQKKWVDPEESAKKVAEKYGCKDPAKVLKCLKRILSAGFDIKLDKEKIENNNGIINEKDLKTVRECAIKIVEATRREGFNGEGRFSKELLNDELNEDVMTKTILHERDVILAHSLYRTAKSAGPNVRKIVGVVGSGHVPGMAKILMQLNNDEELDEVQKNAHDEYLNDFPADVEKPNYSNTMTGLAAAIGGMTLLRMKKPAIASRISSAVPVFFGMALGGVTVASFVAANALVKVGSFAEKLQEASLRSSPITFRERDLDTDGDTREVIRRARIRNGVVKYNNNRSGGLTSLEEEF